MAAEKLQEVRKLSISRETMRKWMAGAGKAYLGAYWKTLSFYSGKHAVFRTTYASNKDATTGTT